MGSRLEWKIQSAPHVLITIENLVTESVLE